MICSGDKNDETGIQTKINLTPEPLLLTLQNWFLDINVQRIPWGMGTGSLIKMPLPGALPPPILMQ